MLKVLVIHRSSGSAHPDLGMPASRFMSWFSIVFTVSCRQGRPRPPDWGCRQRAQHGDGGNGGREQARA